MQTHRRVVNEDVSATEKRWGRVKPMRELIGKEVLVNVFRNVVVTVEGGYHFCREDISECKPIWITVCDGHIFEGHQLHWANCFFSNAHRAEIEHYLNTCPERESWANDRQVREAGLGEFSFSIREMTAEELEKYPEALDFCQQLIKEYGEC